MRVDRVQAALPWVFSCISGRSAKAAASGSPAARLVKSMGLEHRLHDIPADSATLDVLQIAPLRGVCLMLASDSPLLCLGWEIGDTTCQVQVRELG
ncbi:MAG: hypothetical protein CBD11_00070 [Phycisphaera sp. TMED151]|nr:MAG: hypothetical protein CBD11_00070 [Phycisphaera sp. TMED151]